MAIGSTSTDVTEGGSEMVTGALKTGIKSLRERRSIEQESLMGRGMGTLKKIPISTSPQSSRRRAINIGNDVPSFSPSPYFSTAPQLLQKSGEKQDYQEFGRSFKGKEHTNQTGTRKGESRVFDLKKVSSTSNGDSELVVEHENIIGENKNALWSGGKQLSERYDDDTSGMLQESETTRRSGTVNHTDATTAATPTTKNYNKIKIKSSKEKRVKTKEQLGQESLAASSEPIIGHGSRHQRTSNNKPSSSKKVVSGTSKTVNGLSDREMDTFFSTISSASAEQPVASSATDSLSFSAEAQHQQQPSMASENGEIFQVRIPLQKGSGRSKRAQSEPTPTYNSINSNIYNRNSIHPHRHTTGSYKKHTDETNQRSNLSPFHYSISTNPTWPNADVTRGSNNNAATMEETGKPSDFSSDEDSFNFINNNFNRYESRKYSNSNNENVMKSTTPWSTTSFFEGKMQQHREENSPPEENLIGTLSTPFSSFSSLPSSSMSATSSVLIPSPVDDYVNDDDLVILAGRRKRRYRGETSDSFQQATASSRYNSIGNNRETHHENDVDGNSNSESKIIFPRDNVPYQPATFNFASAEDRNRAHSKEPSYYPKMQSFDQQGTTSDYGSSNENKEDASMIKKNKSVDSQAQYSTEKYGEPVAQHRHVDKPTGSPFHSSSNSVVGADAREHNHRYRGSSSGEVISDSDDDRKRSVGSSEGVVGGDGTYFCRDSPHYVVYSWILGMVSLAAFLKLYFMVKATIIAFLFLTYSVLIVWPFKDLFRIDGGDEGGINA